MINELGMLGTIFRFLVIVLTVVGLAYIMVFYGPPIEPSKKKTHSEQIQTT